MKLLKNKGACPLFIMESIWSGPGLGTQTVLNKHLINEGKMEQDAKIIKPLHQDPGQAAQLVKASSQCTKVAGLIPSQGIQESTNDA